MWRNYLFLILLSGATASAQSLAESYIGIGRAATPAEIKAWDIDVRADFKGLPKGSGSVARGGVVWQEKCASCHGEFGESNQVFPPLVGGVSKDDIVRGRVAGLIDGKQPYRTTLMKVSQVSTLWDYINRAMPWNLPKSLSTDDVYAVTAYMLNMGDILPDDYVMSDANIRAVQERLPNRNGKTAAHGLWAVDGKPDTQNTACMTACGEGKVVSSLPDYARDAHGNLAEQNRTIGPFRGVDTSKPPSTQAIPAQISNLLPTLMPALMPALTPAQLPAVALPSAQPALQTAVLGANTAAVRAVSTSGSSASMATTSTKTSTTTPPLAAPSTAASNTPSSPPARAAVDIKSMLSKHQCMACHGLNNKIVGPSFTDITKKYNAKPDATAYLSGRIKQGGQGVWGAIPMPAQALPFADAKLISEWLVGGMK